MRFGFFDQLPCPSGFSERQRYRDFIAQIELGMRSASIQPGSGKFTSAAHSLFWLIR
jgi:hypothetical protein